MTIEPGDIENPDSPEILLGELQDFVSIAKKELKKCYSKITNYGTTASPSAAAS